MLLQLREYTKIDRQMHTQTHTETHTYNKTQCLSQSAKTLRKYFEKFSERLRWPPAACKSWNERCTKLTFIYSFQLGFLFSFSMRALPKKTNNNNNKSSSNQFEGFCERALELSFWLCELLFRCENSYVAVWVALAALIAWLGIIESWPSWILSAPPPVHIESSHLIYQST